MADAFRTLSAFRRDLLTAARVYPNPEFEPLANHAKAADLEWLIARIDEHLAKKPAHLNDPDFPVALKEAFLHYRTIADQIRHTKLTLEHQNTQRSVNVRFCISIGVSVLALVVSVIALIEKH
jgi:hypothetical protein